MGLLSLVENAQHVKHWTPEPEGSPTRDPATFAREVLWCGRRGGSMLRPEVES